MTILQSKSLSESIDLAKQGRESMTKCPAHDDGTASLHVAPGKSQPVVMMCHAQCNINEILDAAGIDQSELLAPRSEADFGTDQDRYTPAGRWSHRYPYVDERGALLYEVLRIPLAGGDKTFRQRRANPDNPKRWIWNIQDVRRVLYRLPEVLQGVVDGRRIWVVEGEKDADSLCAIGEVATTSPMGAGKWHEEFSEMLSGAAVTIVADKDATGQAHARQVKESLESHGASVRVMEAPGKHKDVSDLLQAGGTLDDLLETSPEAVATKEHGGVDILDAVQRTFDEKQFVIPGTMAKGDRMIITGYEGHGKSMLLRQIAAQVAAGIHPFNGKKIPPKRVLYIDAENHPNQVLESWQQLVGLAARHDSPMEPGQLIILEGWDTPPDLISEHGRQWLVERMHAYRPDLVCIGPMYNITGKDLKDDETVRRLKTVINEIRGLYDSAIIMEHHAPHRANGDSKRSVRPYGSSTILRWPEFGFGLLPIDDQEGCYEWIPWRGARVRNREFPEAVRWGKKNTDEFPWVPAFMDQSGKVN